MDHSNSPWEPARAFWLDRRVAVTGATGFLGSHLVGLLTDAGAHVVILERDRVEPTAIASHWLPRVAIVTGDATNQALLERLLGEYEVQTVFHLAAQTQIQVANHNPVSTFESNIKGTWSLLEAVRRTPHIEQAICASSDKAYGAQPTLPYEETMPLLAVNPYDVSKACADLITQTYHQRWGTPVAITRCGNFFGPGDMNWERLVPGTIRSLLRGERPIIRSNGALIRDYLYVVDGALAYLRLAEAMATDPSHLGEAYNFSTERPLSVLELVAYIQTAAGTNLVPDVRDTAGHEIDAQHLSARKAKTRLGWQPNHTVEDALIETVRWYASHLE